MSTPIPAFAGTSLGQQHASGQCADAGDAGQHLDQGAKGIETRLDLLIDLGDGPVEGIDLLQMQPEQEAMVPRDAAAQGFAQHRG
jgi:hypothetical protein